MNLWEINSYVKSLIDAYPAFADKGIEAILDDGTYPQIPGLEKQLRTRGLALVVWELDSIGLISTAKNGLAHELLHIAVVIFENESVNRADPVEGIDPAGILPLQAYEHIVKAVNGQPRNTPPGTPIQLFEDPWTNMGNVNGSNTIIVNFTKEHRIAP